MKKIYYNEVVPQDKSAMALERCNTMDIKDGIQEERLIARTSSASSLDHLTEVPTASRVTSREVSRSLSEDSLFKGQSRETKAFTEDDLSSSWLYKTMQASINARFKSPRKSPSLITTGYLEPVTIKDPKLKPIPVKSRASRTSSCLCHFATLVGVSLCAVGFLASIGAIIYMEVFAGRNLTSLHTSEAQVDLSDVVLNSLETYNLTTHGLDSDEHKMIEKSTDETSIKDVRTSPENVVRPSAERIIGAENPPNLIKLNQYINTTETKIKFQDKDTVILEIKSRDSTATAKSSNDNFSVGNFEGNLNETEQTSFKDQSSKSISEKNLKRDEVSPDSEFNTIEDSSVTESKRDSDSNLQFEGNEIKDLIKPENKFKYEDAHEGSMKMKDPETLDSFFKRTFEKVTNPIKHLDMYELFNSKEESEKVSNPATNDLFQVDKKMKSSNLVKEDSNGIKPVSNDFSDLSEQRLLGSQPEDENSSPVQNIYNSVKTEHDVDSMVMMVDEPEEESTDLFIPNNNEENTPFEFSSIRSTLVQTEGERNVLVNRPVDIKVSLAEAMKHLQVLDTQNKLLTSRTKLKPKVKTSKKQKNVSWKDEDSTLEKQRYLQKVRFMLYNQLQ